MASILPIDFRVNPEWAGIPFADNNFVKHDSSSLTLTAEWDEQQHTIVLGEYAFALSAEQVVHAKEEATSVIERFDPLLDHEAFLKIVSSLPSLSHNDRLSKTVAAFSIFPVKTHSGFVLWHRILDLTVQRNAVKLINGNYPDIGLKIAELALSFLRNKIFD